MSDAPGTALSGRLEDDQIEEVLRNAFAPHRCIVKFDGKRVALRIYVAPCRMAMRGMEGRQYFVEGSRIALLRHRDALFQYIEDVRFHLRQHKVTFNDC